MYKRTQICSKNYYILPNSPVVNESTPFISNPIPYPEYLYLLISTFSTNLTELNKEFPSVGSLLST